MLCISYVGSDANHHFIFVELIFSHRFGVDIEFILYCQLNFYNLN